MWILWPFGWASVLESAPSQGLALLTLNRGIDTLGCEIKQPTGSGVQEKESGAARGIPALRETAENGFEELGEKNGIIFGINNGRKSEFLSEKCGGGWSSCKTQLLLLKKDENVNLLGLISPTINEWGGGVHPSHTTAGRGGRTFPEMGISSWVFGPQNRVCGSPSGAGSTSWSFCSHQRAEGEEKTPKLGQNQIPGMQGGARPTFPAWKRHSRGMTTMATMTKRWQRW